MKGRCFAFLASLDEGLKVDCKLYHCEGQMLFNRRKWKCRFWRRSKYFWNELFSRQGMECGWTSLTNAVGALAEEHVASAICPVSGKDNLMVNSSYCCKWNAVIAFKCSCSNDQIKKPINYTEKVSIQWNGFGALLVRHDSQAASAGFIASVSWFQPNSFRCPFEATCKVAPIFKKGCQLMYAACTSCMACLFFLKFWASLIMIGAHPVSFDCSCHVDRHSHALNRYLKSIGNSEKLAAYRKNVTPSVQLLRTCVNETGIKCLSRLKGIWSSSISVQCPAEDTESRIVSIVPYKVKNFKQFPDNWPYVLPKDIGIPSLYTSGQLLICEFLDFFSKEDYDHQSGSRSMVYWAIF